MKQNRAAGLQVSQTKFQEEVLEEKKIAPGFSDTQTLFLTGDAIKILKKFPNEYFDCCITSPPYWRHREYNVLGIGLENTYQEYIANLVSIFVELHRVLKSTGSLWLNIGDSYLDKQLVGIPWRVALSLTDNVRYILRNSVVWHKLKGSPDNSKDKLRSVYEHLFHFVKNKKYYYNIDAIRANARSAKIENGRVVSATGVSGIRYKRQIELSTALSESEKREALSGLESVLEDMKAGHISDFRMVIRAQQRTTHSNMEKVSGRAKELKEKGFYFLKYHPNGTKPGDVWEILPEDSQKRDDHYAAYPEELCYWPILLSCPPDGVVLDPFCGTGTTMKVAQILGRRSVGIDISQKYIDMAMERCRL
ncbi:MAG: site-specific DNA-methyltransferase [Blastocatellia bacterium]|nr:site-specific DNA-methyltransferase [Blastocatellia bacterium]